MKIKSILKTILLAQFFVIFCEKIYSDQQNLYNILRNAEISIADSRAAIDDFLAKEKDINTKFIAERNVLFAAADRDSEVVKYLIAKGIDVNCTSDFYDQNVLTFICCWLNLENISQNIYKNVEILISNKIDLNWIDKDGKYALSHLAYAFKVVNDKLSNASITEENKAAYLDSQNKILNLVRLLLKNGALLNPNFISKTSSHELAKEFSVYLADCSDSEIIKQLDLMI